MELEFEVERKPLRLVTCSSSASESEVELLPSSVLAVLAWTTCVPFVVLDVVDTVVVDDAVVLLDVVVDVTTKLI